MLLRVGFLLGDHLIPAAVEVGARAPDALRDSDACSDLRQLSAALNFPSRKKLMTRSQSVTCLSRAKRVGLIDWNARARRKSWI